MKPLETVSAAAPYVLMPCTRMVDVGVVVNAPASVTVPSVTSVPELLTAALNVPPTIVIV
ncbi:MAG: hypothetical protein ABI442_17835 [Gemmatimonadaceae bacterium]